MEVVGGAIVPGAELLSYPISGLPANFLLFLGSGSTRTITIWKTTPDPSRESGVSNYICQDLRIATGHQLPVEPAGQVTAGPLGHGWPLILPT